MSLPDELAKLAGLRRSGLLSEEEFDKAKQLTLAGAARRLSGDPPGRPAASGSPAAATPTSSKRQKTTGREWVDLPVPSTEQRVVLDAVASGGCAAVTSVAGSGKTTLMLQIAADLQRRQPGRQALIVTYNRALRDECDERIRQLGLKTTVRSYTLHSLVAMSAGASCKNDTEMLKITESWNSGATVPASLPCGVVLLDEVQDLRPSFYSALRHILRAANPGGQSMQMVLVGDPKQLLYDFPGYGSDKASAQYLERPSEFFGGELTRGREWRQLQLSVSYRLTPSMASVVNVIWGTAIVGGSQAEDIPVEYWYPNTPSCQHPSFTLQLGQCGAGQTSISGLSVI
jgi:hypothetical protein